MVDLKRVSWETAWFKGSGDVASLPQASHSGYRDTRVTFFLDLWPQGTILDIISLDDPLFARIQP